MITVKQRTLLNFRHMAIVLFYGSYLDGNTTVMEWLLRIYAISPIAGADKYNPWVKDPVPGQLPSQGVQLSVDNPKFIKAILGGIGGFHFLLFVLAEYFANKVIV